MAQVDLHAELVRATINQMFGSVGRERFRVSPGAAPLIDKNRDGWVDRKELEKAIEKDKVALSLKYNALSADGAINREIVKGVVDELDANDGTRDGYIDLTRDGPASLWERLMVFMTLSEEGYAASVFKDLLRVGDIVASAKGILRETAIREGTPVVELVQGVDGPTIGLR